MHTSNHPLEAETNRTARIVQAICQKPAGKSSSSTSTSSPPSSSLTSATTPPRKKKIHLIQQDTEQMNLDLDL